MNATHHTNSGSSRDRTIALETHAECGTGAIAKPCWAEASVCPGGNALGLQTTRRFQHKHPSCVWVCVCACVCVCGHANSFHAPVGVCKRRREPVDDIKRCGGTLCLSVHDPRRRGDGSHSEGRDKWPGARDRFLHVIERGHVVEIVVRFYDVDDDALCPVEAEVDAVH